MNAVIIYQSKTGNTGKVVQAVQQGLEDSGLRVTVTKVHEAESLDFFDFDLVCLAFGSYNWSPPQAMNKFLKTKFREYGAQGRVKPGAPRIEGKNGLIICTYSGPHTGIREAIPAGLYAGQFLEHLGFTVLDEWYIVAEYIGSQEQSTKGRLGDIRGLPSDQDLRQIRNDAHRLAHSLLA